MPLKYLGVTLLERKCHRYDGERDADSWRRTARRLDGLSGALDDYGDAWAQVG